jgi:hypothetical protein
MSSSHKIEQAKKIILKKSSKWSGQPVAIVDMDDVLVKFRDGFSEWIQRKHNVKPNVLSKEYYFIEDLKSAEIDPESVFLEFISDSGFLNLDPVDCSKDLLLTLKEKGYWIQILTARPGDNQACVCDTFKWLRLNDMPYDMVSFSGNKLEWCEMSEYHETESIAFAIDDSPKHAKRYSSNSFMCYVPKKTYNTGVWKLENISTYDGLQELIEKIK